MYTLVLNLPNFIGVGRVVVCCFRFSGVLGKLCTSCQFALSYGLVLGVVTRIALSVKNWTQKSIPVKLTAEE